MPKGLNWRAGLKRIALIYAVCGMVAVGWVLLREPYWFSICERSFVLAARPDQGDWLRQAEQIRERRETQCVAPENRFAADNRNRLAALGMTVRPLCEPLVRTRIIPEQTVTRTNTEVLSCTVDRTMWTMRESRALRLALWLLALPLLMVGGYRVGRWVWRGFKS